MAAARRGNSTPRRALTSGPYGPPPLPLPLPGHPDEQRQQAQQQLVVRRIYFEETVAKLDAEARGTRLVEEELAV